MFLKSFRSGMLEIYPRGSMKMWGVTVVIFFFKGDLGSLYILYSLLLFSAWWIEYHAKIERCRFIDSKIWYRYVLT